MAVCGHSNQTWGCGKCLAEATAEVERLRSEVVSLRNAGAVDPMRWIRAFNSLEKAVTNVLDDDHPANLDYLARAHAATLREVGPNP